MKFYAEPKLGEFIIKKHRRSTNCSYSTGRLSGNTASRAHVEKCGVGDKVKDRVRVSGNPKGGISKQPVRHINISPRDGDVNLPEKKVELP